MTTTGVRPPPVERPRRRGGVVGPLILIFIGLVFLLQNTGYLPPNFWANLWRLWPVVLVLIGLELLLAHRLPRPVLAALALVVLIAGALLIGSNVAAPGAGPPVSRSVRTDLAGASQAAITVRFGAGQLDVAPLADAQAGELATMNYEGPPQLAPQPRYTPAQGGIGQLDYESFGPNSGRSGQGFGPFLNGGSARLDLQIAPDVPITSFQIQTGATSAHMDLSGLRVSNLDVSIGAATAWLRFPATAGLTTAHISGGASTMTLEIPQGVSAQIQTRGGLSTFNIDQSRFPQVSEGVYRSSDYASAANRLDLAIETGVTTIQVN